MRAVAAVAVFCLACNKPAPPRAPEPVVGAIDPQTFSDKLAGLRATLARSGVSLDNDLPDPVIEICDGNHTCARCELARREDTRDLDPSNLDGVALAFGSYPPSLLVAAKLEHVALCRKIDDNYHPDVRPGGLAIASEHRVFIDVAQFAIKGVSYDHYNIEQVVHHELFHLFDRATLGEAAEKYRPWLALNPPGFAYRDPAPQVTVRPRGFVNPYATTNDLEDRASVFEYLMGQPDQLCAIMAEDPIVAAKTKAVWKRVAKVIGDKLLHQHAPCVSFIRHEQAPAHRRGPVQLFPQRAK